MIAVSEEIRQAYSKSTTQVDRIKVNNNYYAITNVVYNDDCYDEGNVFGTAMGRILTFDIETSIAMEMKEFEYQTGVIIEDAENYISLGNFIVTDTEEGNTTDITHVTAIDYMLKTNIIYETHLNYSNATLLDVLQEVCTNCGISLATLIFTNSDFRVDSNQFESNTLCREVIQAIAQVSGTIAKIKADNRLYLINPNQVANVSQVFDTKDYSEAEIKRLTHPINVVSLTESEIEGENVTMRDESSIAQDGENSIIINDNPFAYNQEKRTQLITGLFNAIKGFEYKSYALKFQMLPWIETLDKVQVKDKEGNNTYNSYVFRLEYHSPDGLKSTIEAPSLIKATIDYQNIPDALDIARRTEIIVDKQNQTITSVVSNVSEQNTKIAQVQQTVNELNSKISDIADITTSQETNTGRLLFDDINQSEPIHVEIRPLGQNISYLYPRNNLFPANDLYITLRTLRFTNTSTNEIFDYELPDDLLYYDNENYDEFILDYDSQTVYVNKKCAYDSNGNVALLAQERIDEYTFPHIELTDGDYKVEILKYDNTPYGAYLFCRLMAQNVYTTQFATKAEMHSEISQTAESIDLSVNQKLSNYSTTSEMNSAINLKANEISSTVSETYATKNQLNNYSTTSQMNSAINQKADSITSSVSATYVTKTNANNTYATKSTLTQTANSLQSQITSNDNDISAINQNIDEVEINVGKKYNTSDFTNAKITAKINDGTSSVKINASKIDLTGKTINMTSDNINISSNNFNVTKYGKVTVTDTGTDGNLEIKTSNGNFSTKVVSPGLIAEGPNGYVDINADFTFAGGSIYVAPNQMTMSSGSNYTFIQNGTVSAQTITQHSKESVKKNIKLYDKNVLDLIKNSEIYEYNYKSEEDTDKKHIGFVIGDEGGNYKTPTEVVAQNEEGIDSYIMESILWKAVQEQQEEIEDLRKKVIELEGK